MFPATAGTVGELAPLTVKNPERSISPLCVAIKRAPDVPAAPVSPLAPDPLSVADEVSDPFPALTNKAMLPPFPPIPAELTAPPCARINPATSRSPVGISETAAIIATTALSAGTLPPMGGATGVVAPPVPLTLGPPEALIRAPHVRVPPDRSRRGPPAPPTPVP